MKFVYVIFGAQRVVFESGYLDFRLHILHDKQSIQSLHLFKSKVVIDGDLMSDYMNAAGAFLLFESLIFLSLSSFN